MKSYTTGLNSDQDVETASGLANALRNIGRLPEEMLNGICANTHKKALMKMYSELLSATPENPIVVSRVLDYLDLPTLSLNPLGIVISEYKELFSNKIGQHIVGTQEERIHEILVEDNSDVKELRMFFIRMEDSYFVYKIFSSNRGSGDSTNEAILVKFNSKLDFAVFIKRFVSSATKSQFDLVYGRDFDDLISEVWAVEKELPFKSNYSRIYADGWLDDCYLTDLRNPDSYIEYVLTRVKTDRAELQKTYSELFDC